MCATNCGLFRFKGGFLRACWGLSVFSPCHFLRNTRTHTHAFKVELGRRVFAHTRSSKAFFVNAFNSQLLVSPSWLLVHI